VLWATKLVATIIRCSISASQSCSRSWRQRAVTGVMHEILSNLGNLQLLIIDDCGCRPLMQTLVTICWRFLKSAKVDDQQSATLIGDPTYADVILDRMVHNAHRIEE
jgi:DNA replication protein DnaC